MTDPASFEHIAYDVADNVATITLNRPDKLNAFTATMARELIGVFDVIDADDEVRAVVVTGAGRGFCAGADLSGGGDTFSYAEGAEEAHRDGGGLVTLRIFESLKPVIGAINGPAVGVGVTMQLPMDMRLASTDARFGLVFARRGIVPEAASSWFLPRIVGISKALEWCETGRIFDAQEALDGGLVRSVHAPDELLPAAYALAQEIAQNAAPVSVALTRQMLWRFAGAPDPFELLAIDKPMSVERGGHADVREGVQAFIEKRPPSFRGKVSQDMPSQYPWWEGPQTG